MLFTHMDVYERMVDEIRFYTRIISSHRITIPDEHFQMLEAEKGDIVEVEVNIPDRNNE